MNTSAGQVFEADEGVTENVKRVAITFETNFLEKMDRLARNQGISKSDMIARALKLYEFFVTEQKKGGGVYIEGGEGEKVRIRIF